MADVTMVRANRLTKTYELFESPVERVRCRIGLAEPRLLTAVEDVSFEVAAGRALGVVGENGAGKSTLLRLLAGITRPTAGSCEVTGRVGSILELGAGFHTELTGRQNIRLSAALADLDPLDIAQLTDEIIAFSELDAFIDEPVKRYSSGMVVRLAFAIATRSEPDVLIVDEALSVGDGRFQKKCLDRIRSFLEEGGALVFSTHALYSMTSICEEAVWLRRGKVEASGEASEVAREYDAYLRRDERAATVDPGPDDRTQGDQPTITGVRLLGAASEEEPVATYEPGRPWGVEIAFTSSDRNLPVHVAVSVDTSDRREVFLCATHRDGLPPVRGRLRYQARVRVPDLPLHSGEFQLHVFLLDEAGLHVYAHELLPVAFRVTGGIYSPALIDPPHEWELPTES